MKRTELKRYAETTPAWQDRSRRPLRPVSPAKRRWIHAYLEARQSVIQRAEGMCEAWLPGCTHIGAEVHHTKGRVGPDANHLDNLRLLCAHCHGRVHANPEQSYLVGLMRKRTAKEES